MDKNQQLQMAVKNLLAIADEIFAKAVPCGCLWNMAVKVSTRLNNTTSSKAGSVEFQFDSHEKFGFDILAHPDFDQRGRMPVRDAIVQAFVHTGYVNDIKIGTSTYMGMYRHFEISFEVDLPAVSADGQSRPTDEPTYAHIEKSNDDGAKLFDSQQEIADLKNRVVTLEQYVANQSSMTFASSGLCASIGLPSETDVVTIDHVEGCSDIITHSFGETIKSALLLKVDLVDKSKKIVEAFLLKYTSTEDSFKLDADMPSGNYVILISPNDRRTMFGMPDSQGPF